jgi:hypothetical protein
MGDNNNHRTFKARLILDKNPASSGILSNVSTVDLAIPMPSYCDIIHAITKEECAHLIESSAGFFEKILLSCERQINPVLIYADFSVLGVPEDQEVLLKEGRSLSCPGRLFTGASHVIAAIGTIGSDLENQVAAAFQSGDPFSAVALDAVGSIMLKRMIEEFYKTCSMKAAEASMGIGPRVSPGCYRTPLSCQKTLFSLLDASRIEVTLSSSCLMSPIKSSSLFFPLGERIPAPLRTSDWCKFCDFRERCYSRYV